MHVSLSYKVSDMIKLQAGYGSVATERTIGATTTELERTSTYVNAPITLAKGFELQVFHEMDDYGESVVTNVPNNIAQGEMTYTGARWVISF